MVREINTVKIGDLALIPAQQRKAPGHAWHRRCCLADDDGKLRRRRMIDEVAQLKRGGGAAAAHKPSRSVRHWRIPAPMPREYLQTGQEIIWNLGVPEVSISIMVRPRAGSRSNGNRTRTRPATTGPRPEAASRPSPSALCTRGIGTASPVAYPPRAHRTCAGTG